MRLNELFDEESFGVPTPSPEEVAAKHGVPLEQIQRQLEKGAKAEMEHTEDWTMAQEIALDHLSEMPDYYDKLATIEPEHVDEEVSPEELEKLEDELNDELFDEVPVELDFPTDADDHFMQRAQERDLDADEIETVMRKGLKQNQDQIQHLAKQNKPRNPGEGTHFLDPETKIDIPVNVRPNPITDFVDPPKGQSPREEGNPIAKTKSGPKPKNKVVPKTVIRRGVDSGVWK